MLDDTLIVCTTEHGRTPRMENSTGGGRGHWAQAYSTILAGACCARQKSSVAPIASRRVCSTRRSPRRICWRRCTICWAATPRR